MKHHVVLEGWECRLRPETEEDNQFVVDLWNQPHVQGHLVMSPLSYEGHKTFFKQYLQTEGSFFWIVENRQSKPVGTLGIDATNNDTCTIGRLAMYPTRDFIVITPLFMMYRFIFETLKLIRAQFTVLIDNRAAIKLHQIMGAVDIGENITKVASSGVRIELAQYELTTDKWQRVANKLQQML